MVYFRCIVAVCRVFQIIFNSNVVFVSQSSATLFEISTPNIAKTSLPFATTTSFSLLRKGTFLSVRKSPALFVPPPNFLIKSPFSTLLKTEFSGNLSPSIYSVLLQFSAPFSRNFSLQTLSIFVIFTPRSANSSSQNFFASHSFFFSFFAKTIYSQYLCATSQ